MRDVTYEMLIDFAEGRLAAEQAVQVQAFLADHPEARATVQRYREARELARSSTELVSPPAKAIAKAKALFQRVAPAPRPGWLERLDAVLAELVFDSRQQALAVRRLDGDGRVQLAYECEAADIDLQLIPLMTETTGGSQLWRVRGQVTAEQSGAVTVALVYEGERDPVNETTVTDDSGMFEMDVRGGRYDLCVAIDETLVVVPEVRLSE